MVKKRIMILIAYLSALYTPQPLKSNFETIVKEIDEELHKTHQTVKKMTHSAFNGWFDEEDENKIKEPKIIMKELPDQNSFTLTVAEVKEAPLFGQETWTVKVRPGFARFELPLVNGTIIVTIDAQRRIVSTETVQKEEQKKSKKHRYHNHFTQHSSGFSRSLINKPSYEKPTTHYNAEDQILVISLKTIPNDYAKPDPFAKKLRHYNGIKK